MKLNRNIKSIGKALLNIPGWHTKRKIIVIESDDWGSIRMPSKEIYNNALYLGYPVDKNAYERYDSLASETDLMLLFKLLSSFQDKNGNHPIITANTIVANPNFEKIKENNFQQYHYELITETFEKYPEHKNNFAIWQEGIAKKIFHPQYHGREHLNVSLFMEALKKNDRDACFAFNNHMPGSISLDSIVKGNQYVASTKYNSLEDKAEKLEIFLEGLDIFEKFFGYVSKSIVPPNFYWSLDFNQSVSDKGVKYIQGIHTMWEPVPKKNNRKHQIYLGKKTKGDMIFLMRNVQFEPSQFRKKSIDPVGECLSGIDLAFKFNKPAIISSHRLNYVGYIDPKNRGKNLKMLKDIFVRALKSWPEIEFFSSDQLGDLISLKK